MLVSSKVHVGWWRHSALRRHTSPASRVAKPSHAASGMTLTEAGRADQLLGDVSRLTSGTAEVSEVGSTWVDLAPGAAGQKPVSLSRG